MSVHVAVEKAGILTTGVKVSVVKLTARVHGHSRNELSVPLAFFVIGGENAPIVEVALGLSPLAHCLWFEHSPSWSHVASGHGAGE